MNAVTATGTTPVPHLPLPSTLQDVAVLLAAQAHTQELEAARQRSYAALASTYGQYEDQRQLAKGHTAVADLADACARRFRAAQQVVEEAILRRA